VPTPTSRRSFISAAGAFALAGPLLAACGGQAAPTTGSSAASSTSAPSSAGQGASGSTAKPVALTMAVYPDRPWMKKWPNMWATQNAGSSVKIDDIPYGDMNTKQLTLLASGTMPDVVFSGNKWLRYVIFKGAFAPIDEYVKVKPYDKADFIASAIDGAMFEGKLYGLPFEWNSGNTNVVVYNKDMVSKKGVKEPTDTWTHDDFTEFAVKMTDNAAGIYGTDLFPGTYYDFGDNVRDVGGDVMSDDGKKFLMATDAKNREVAQWLTDLRVKHKAAPDRAGQAQEQLLASGRIASTATGAVSVKSIATQIGDKFKWGAALGPTGKEGLRGYDSFSAHWNIYSKSKAPDRAYDLVMFITSKEAATDALRTDGQVPARLSVWKDPKANEVSDIFSRVADWVGNPKHKGPFPIPANLRYTELETAYENVGYPIFYGEVPFEDGLKKVQEECQKIMDLPRG
jgi:ABC-type glycerol-3-phosphate transport system substrate-binding protein